MRQSHETNKKSHETNKRMCKQARASKDALMIAAKNATKCENMSLFSKKFTLALYRK